MLEYLKDSKFFETICVVIYIKTIKEKLISYQIVYNRHNLCKYAFSKVFTEKIYPP